MRKIAVVLLIIFVFLVSTSVYADAAEIYRICESSAINSIRQSPEQTGWMVADGTDVGGFLLTENGYILTDGDAADKTVTLECDGNQRVITFSPSHTYKFESLATLAETFNGDIAEEDGNSFLSASADLPSDIILQNSIKGTGFTLTFDACKSISEAAVLFSVCDINDDTACEVKLNRRGSTAFYPACLEETGYTFYRDYLIPINEWFSVEVYADFENGTVNIKIPSVSFDVTYALSECADSDFAVYKIIFGQNVDNVNFYNGKKIEAADISFDVADVINIPSDNYRHCMDIPVMATFDGVSGRLAKTADFIVYSDDVNVSPDGIMTLPKDMTEALIKSRCYVMGENIEITKNISFVTGDNENAFPLDYPAVDVVKLDLDNNKALISGYNPTESGFLADVYICIFENQECLKIQKHSITMEALCGNFEEEILIDVSDMDMTGMVVKAFVLNESLKELQ